MNTERPIREFYDLLPEPERTEANAARDRAEARDPEHYKDIQLASSLPEALDKGFLYHIDTCDFDKWCGIYYRAEAGEFDAPSEVDRLRARIAELEGVLEPFAHFAEKWIAMPAGNIPDDYAIYAIHGNTEHGAEITLGACKNARTILNKK